MSDEDQESEPAIDEKKQWLGQVITKGQADNSTDKTIVEDLKEPENTVAPDSIDQEKTKNQKHLLIYSVSGLAAVLIIWLFGAMFISKFALANKAYSSNLSDTALISKINNQIKAYKLTVAYPNGTKKYYGLSNLGLDLNSKKTLSSMHGSEHRLTNLLMWWRPIKVSLIFNKNEAMFNSFINTSTQITVQPSQDASLSITGGKISIVGAVTGKQYGLINGASSLINTATDLNTSPIKLQTLAVNPALTADELAPYKTTLSSTLNQNASFVVGGQTITASASDIANWLEITPNDKTKKVAITVNSGKVLAYIDSIASPITHPAKAQVMVSNNGTTQVLVPGVNGISVTNENAIATRVASDLLSSKGISETLPINTQPFETITAGNYPKWIEVDTTNKRLYAYEFTNLVTTDLVTAGAPATPTVTGQFAIYSKFTTQDMQGENVDGSSYFQPHVPWINYFYKDYAIHGNYWRPTSYFGNVNSSHGCVGLGDDDASWIYSWAPIGTPVIVHT